MITVYGISNCDTVRKARRWLDEHGIAYRFHDFRKDGLNRENVEAWAKELGWEKLLNRRGTTWRQLPESVRDKIDARSAIDLMLESPALIKRPVVESGSGLLIGFDSARWQAILAAETE